ncbi:MAG: undecaprenyl-phosphate galactose phosphotransferase WbaP [Planctomycetaceae bacterium]
MSTADTGHQTPQSALSSRDTIPAITSEEFLNQPEGSSSTGNKVVPYLLQALRTSLPLIAFDQLWIAGTMLVVAYFSQWVAGRAVMTWSTTAQISAICCAASFLLGRLYPGAGVGGLVELRRIISSLCLGFALTWLVLAIGGTPTTSLSFSLLVALGLAGGTLPLARRFFKIYLGRFDWWTQPVLIFGGGNFGASVFRSLSAQRELGLRPIGIIDDWHRQWTDSAIQPEWFLGSFSETSKIAEKHGAFWGCVALEGKSSAEVEDIIDRQICSIPHLIVVAENSATCRQWTGAQICGGIVGKRIDEHLLLPGPQLLKRLGDLVLVGTGMLVFLPVLFALAVAVRLSSKGPIFYSQERIGLGGKKFKAWKFRSMVMNADAVLKDYLAAHPELRAEWERDHKLKNDPRVTFVGWFLRKTSLDELPQLWNVLIGDMSLVGPRPIVDAEVKKYAAAFPLYLKVRPGITGLWQINGRNNTTYQQRVHFDMQYVRNWSPWLDGYILLHTIEVVLRCKGAY